MVWSGRGGRSTGPNSWDCFEAHVESCQRRLAQRMLNDFERSGIDEDLEQLKAGWASPFGHRGGFPPPGRSVSMPRDAAALAIPAAGSVRPQESCSPVGSLAMQGTLAQERLQQLASLRQMAGSPSGAAKKGIPVVDPKDRRRPARRTQPPKKPLFQVDPWDSWASRWSEAFRLFDELHQMRHGPEEPSSEEEEAEAEARSRREAEWRRKVEEVKRQRAQAAAASAAAGARARQEEARRPPSAKARPEPKRSAGPSSRGQPSSSSSSPQPEKPQPAPPPRPPPAPAKAAGPPPITRYSDFEAAWARFEQEVAPTRERLRFGDIPWPTALPSISGATAGDTPEERKRKLRTALVRWHPDKWSGLLGRVADSDRPQVMERVKEVTQRILEEKRVFGS